MNKYGFVFVAALLGAGVYLAAGPAPASKDASKEIAGGVDPSAGMGAGPACCAMEELMNNPLHRQMMSVFVLPEMQSELGLSAQQVAELRRLRRDLVAKSRDIAAQTAGRRHELDLLLSGDTSRTRAVKALLEKIGDLHAQLQYAGFDTSNRMKTLLNDGQRAKLGSMRPADLHRVMMSRVNMTEMEEMMQQMSEGLANPHRGMMHDMHETPPPASPDHHGTNQRGPA